MRIKNIDNIEYFTSADGCKIAETFGIPSEGIKDASIAYAILPSGKRTLPHRHNFSEWYIIIKGNGEMRIGTEKKPVKAGDNVMTLKNQWHSICTKGEDALEFYCFCVPAFTLRGTTMKNKKEPRESIKRNWKPNSNSRI